MRLAGHSHPRADAELLVSMIYSETNSRMFVIITVPIAPARGMSTSRAYYPNCSTRLSEAIIPQSRKCNPNLFHTDEKTRRSLHRRARCNDRETRVRQLDDNWTSNRCRIFSLKRAGSRGLDFLDVAHRAAQAQRLRARRRPDRNQLAAARTPPPQSMANFRMSPAVRAGSAATIGRDRPTRRRSTVFRILHMQRWHPPHTSATGHRPCRRPCQASPPLPDAWHQA